MRCGDWQQTGLSKLVLSAFLNVPRGISIMFAYLLSPLTERSNVTAYPKSAVVVAKEVVSEVLKHGRVVSHPYTYSIAMVCTTLDHLPCNRY